MKAGNIRQVGEQAGLGPAVHIGIRHWHLGAASSTIIITPWALLGVGLALAMLGALTPECLQGGSHRQGGGLGSLKVPRMGHVGSNQAEQYNQ